MDCRVKFNVGRAAISSEDINCESGALRSRRIIGLRAARCRHGLGLERVAQRAAEHDSRIVDASGVAVGSVHAALIGRWMRIFPLLRLAASQEFAQKYPFTTDMAMQAPVQRA
jgi:hypothetical protein